MNFNGKVISGIKKKKKKISYYLCKGKDEGFLSWNKKQTKYCGENKQLIKNLSDKKITFKYKVFLNRDVERSSEDLKSF